MNEEEAIRFVEDLESGAFHASCVGLHKITLDMRNALSGEELTFPEVWDEYRR